jgi:hypothetical protein
MDVLDQLVNLYGLFLGLSLLKSQLIADHPDL